MHGLPSTTTTLLRGLLRRRPGLQGRAIPRIERHADGVRLDPGWLDAYRALTHSPDTDVLPVMAPQMVAGPLHAGILADPALPVGVLGLVHVTQTVTQHRAIPVGAPLEIHAWLEGSRPARQGAELDVHTRVMLDGEVAWEGVTSALARGPWKDPDAPGAPEEGPPLDDDSPAAWSVPADIGRRWRRVSGDPNPIHLSRTLARPFGFKAAIAHGTWLLARIGGHLGEAEGAATLQGRFRRPVFLPGEVELRTVTADTEAGHEVRFEVRERSRDKRCVEGSLAWGAQTG